MNDLMKKLEDIGKEYGCELYLPPFNNSNNPFYCVDEIRHNKFKYKNFLVSLIDRGIKVSSHDIDDKIFIEIELTKEEIEGAEYVV
jgi:hypothetical protein